MTGGERIAREAWRRGDHRLRCEEGHILCVHCRGCACWKDDLDPIEYPAGTMRVTTDNLGRTLCRECRYQHDELGVFSSVYNPPEFHRDRPWRGAEAEGRGM